MDFVRSYFFMNETLTSCLLLCILPLLLGRFAVALLLHPPRSDDKMKKKWATGQSCIRKEVTSFKIHTLGNRAWSYICRNSIIFSLCKMCQTYLRSIYLHWQKMNVYFYDYNRVTKLVLQFSLHCDLTEKKGRIFLR